MTNTIRLTVNPAKQIRTIIRGVGIPGPAGPSGSLILGETSSTAYRGDRGKVAYDHSQSLGNPHGLAWGDIAGTIPLGQLPTQVARNDQANTFAAKQTISSSLSNSSFLSFTSPSPVSGNWNFGGNNFAGSNSNGTDNYVWSFGMNVGPGGLREDNTKPMLREAFESQYYSGGKYQVERHIAFQGTSGVEKRVWSFMAASDGSGCSTSQTSTDHAFNGWDGAQFAKLDATKFSVYKPIQIEYNGVGYQQLNGAGTNYIRLPYINSSNYLQISSKVDILGDGIALQLDSPATNRSRMFSNQGIIIQANAAPITLESATGVTLQANTDSTVNIPLSASVGTVGVSGLVGLVRGFSASATGYIEWRKSTNVRQGYMGSDTGSDITLYNEQSGGRFLTNCAVRSPEFSSVGPIGAYYAESTGVLGSQLYLGDGNFDNATYKKAAPGMGGLYSSITSVCGDLGLFVYDNTTTRKLATEIRYASAGVYNLTQNGAISASGNLSASGVLNVSGDTHKIGSTLIGTGAFGGAWSVLTNDSTISTATYALSSLISSGTYLNCPSGTQIAMRMANGDLMNINSSRVVTYGNSGIQIKNAANSGDGPLTCSSITASGILTSAVQTLSTDPTTSDITSGSARDVKNISTGTTLRWMNDGGIMKAIGGGSSQSTFNYGKALAIGQGL